MLPGNFSNIGKILIFTGLGIAFLGLVIFLFAKIPFFGKLPGDISIRKENFSFYFPVSTSIIVSIILTVLINVVLFLVFRFRK
jgi:heme/copper-type cytochrome/quinol oxidase subunit 2